jgi:flagellin-like protein
MELRKLFTDDRAVSPVVGVALLIAIAVILAAVIGAVVLGLGTGGAETPQAQLNADFDGTDQVTLYHEGGDGLPADEVKVVNRDTGTEVDLGNDLSAGHSETVTLGHSDGDDIAVVWEDPNSDSKTVVATFTYDA